MQNKKASLLLLASMSAIGQFANSVSFPSFPEMATYFHTSMKVIQLLLAVFLASFAVSLLLFGPYSDRVGRKPVAYLSLVVFLLGCCLGIVSTNIAILYTGRILQAVGSAGAMAVSRGMARDYYEGKALAKAATIMTIVYAAAPGLSPLLGSFLAQWGWQPGFAISGVLALGIVLPLLPVKETVNGQRRESKPIRQVYSHLFNSYRFTLYSFTSGFAMAGLFAYLAAAPFVFQNYFSVSADIYGVYPALTISGFVVGSLVVKNKLNNTSVPALTSTGLLLLLISSLLLLVFCKTGLANAMNFTVSMFFFVTGLGMIFPLSMAELLKDFPDTAAAAAAMSGFIQMLGGAIGVYLVSKFNKTGILAIPYSMLVTAITGLVFFRTFYFAYKKVILA